MNKCIIMALAMVFGAAYAQESQLTEINRQIAAVKEEIRLAEKQNPHVYFQEEDNPTMNIERRLGNTKINREYYCPYHRGYRYHNDICGFYHDDHYRRVARTEYGCGCPALSNNITGYPVWRKLYDKVVLTEQCEKLLVDLRVKLQNLMDRRSVVSRIESAQDRAYREGTLDVATPVVITLPRRKVSELYAKKEIRYNGYILQME